MRPAPKKTRAMTDNAAWKGARPAVSVLVPFFRDDPTPLIAALDDEAQALGRSAEVADNVPTTDDQAVIRSNPRLRIVRHDS